MTKEKKYNLGLDIGASKIAGVVFAEGKIVSELTVPTPKNLNDFEKRLQTILKALATGKNVVFIGIGVAGLVDQNTGQILLSPNLTFLNGFQLKKKISQILQVKRIKVENDARCFAWAEASLGQGKKYKNFVGLTLGTGIGGGVILDGRLFYGSHGWAGEVGHIFANNDADFETLFQPLRKHEDFKNLGRLLSRLVIDVIRFYDPEAVILGGGVADNHAQEFFEEIQKGVTEALPKEFLKTKILVSKLKHAGAVGAACIHEAK